MSHAVQLALVLLLIAPGCGTAVRRDLGKVPAGQVGFDDMCHVQDFWDTIVALKGAPPALLQSNDTTGSKGKTGGRSTFRFEGEFQLTHLRRVLGENWKRLPDPLAKASRVDLEVLWAEKAGVQRVAMDADAHLIIDDKSFSLPYHVCLSELLFGEPIYRNRRALLATQ